MLLLISYSVMGADWVISPRLSLVETYTDNVNLAPNGQEQSDFITQVNPGISVRGTGSRLKVSAEYTLQNLFYLQSSRSNQTRQQLQADANAEWLDDLFFTDARASISQANISLLSPTTNDNVNNTGNRTEVKTFLISPYLRRNFGSFASTEVRYTHDIINSSTGRFSNSQADRIDASLNSGAAFNSLGWGLNYSKEVVQNDDFQDTGTKTISTNLRYLLNPRLTLLATYGYEKNNFVSTLDKTGGSFWNAGFAWAPTTRTQVSASAGKRFFGDNYALDLSHRTRRTIWNASYSESISTSRSDLLLSSSVDTATFLDNLFTPNIPDPVARAQFVSDFIIQNGLPSTLFDPLGFLTNQTFLNKRFQASVGLNGVKNTILFSLFQQTRDAQASGGITSTLFGGSDFDSSSSVKQTGANVSWNWRLAPRTSSNVSITYTLNKFQDTGREDELTSFRAGITRRLQPKLSGTVDIRHQERSSNQAGSNFSENAVTASVNMKF